MGLIIIGAIAALLVVWSISVWRKLIGMDENIENAMGQLGVQLSAKFDAMYALLDLVKEYASGETQPLLETLKAKRIVITAVSTPQEVYAQEEVILEVLKRVLVLAEKYPELKTNEEYAKYIGAVDSYEKMVCTSSLIYNDSVNRLNRELQLFPTSVAGSVLGFHKRDYIEAINIL